MKGLGATAVQALTLAMGVIGLLSKVALAQTLVQPRLMPKIGQVDPRFVSYNIEAIEVTGGRFWKPFKDEVAPTNSSPDSGNTASPPTVASFVSTARSVDRSSEWFAETATYIWTPRLMPATDTSNAPMLLAGG